MRLAILSDVHANLTALEAVIRDLRETSPDLVLHGGDLSDGGACPAEVVDRVRDLGWPGVLGNTDEMLFSPESLREFKKGSTAPPALWDAVEEMAAFTRDRLGDERLAWLRRLPMKQTPDGVALVHARPETPWRAPGPDASDAELEAAYEPLGAAVVVYAHIHHPFVRQLPTRIVANAGSVGLPYDGDPRASYLLVDSGQPSVRRVAYDLDAECRLLRASGLPHAEWVMRLQATARPQMP